MKRKISWMALALIGTAGCVCVGAARTSAPAIRMAMQERVGLHTSAMQVTRLRNRRSALSPPGDRRTGWVDVGFVPATRTVFGRDRVWVPRAPTTGQQGSRWRGMLMMAQPRKKLPERSVDVYCMNCKFKLYKYKKGGKGSLVKCYKERIVEDFTGGSLECPNCGVTFARETMVHGKPAFKMIGGKVFKKK